MLLVGLSGSDTPDGHFIRTANSLGVKSVGVNDQDGNYLFRFENFDGIPSYLALMDDACLDTLTDELPENMAKEARKRVKIIGWTAFDSLAKKRDSFSKEKRITLLKELNIDAEKVVAFHATQNIPLGSKYWQTKGGGREEEIRKIFEYEIQVTNQVFQIAKDLGLKLVVKPHPGEKFEVNYTENLARKYGFRFLPADACATQDLILSSNSISAGRSTCLEEGCLLGINTGGILPDIYSAERNRFRAIKLGAIPYAQSWEEIGEILRIINSTEKVDLARLAETRKRFSVDGKASKRLANLVEEALDSN